VCVWSNFDGSDWDECVTVVGSFGWCMCMCVCVCVFVCVDSVNASLLQATQRNKISVSVSVSVSGRSSEQAHLDVVENQTHVLM
jgi:hypothetical protein